MLKVTIIRDPFTLEEKESFEFDGNIYDALREKFDKWPDGARLYHEIVSDETDVTPSCESDIERLARLDGQFYAVLYPKSGWEIVYIIIAIVVSVAAAFLMRPKIPNVANRNQSNPSPNNELAQRVNSARPGGRIPDIFGIVRSTPDLIAVPYSIFDYDVEYELCLMCIGRGHYEIYDCKDGTTPLEQIEGSTVEVYDPGVNIYDGTPVFKIGEGIRDTWPPVYLTRSNSVNGQTLRPPNATNFRGDRDVLPLREGSFNTIITSKRDFTKIFEVGNEVTVTDAIKLFNPFRQNILMNPTYGGAFWFPGSSIPPNWEVGSLCQILAGTFTLWRYTQTGTEPNPNYPNPNNPSEPEFLPMNTRVVDRVVDISGLYTISNIVVQNMGGSAGMGVVVYLDNPQAVNPQWQHLVWPADIEGGTRQVILSRDGVEYNLNGDYLVQAVSQHRLYFANPAAINPDWNKTLTSFNWSEGNAISPTITLKGFDGWVGDFILKDPTGDIVLTSFVALNGLYKDDGKKQLALDVVIEVEITPVDANGAAVGAPQYISFTWYGSQTKRDSMGISASHYVEGHTGDVRVRARRVTDTDTSFAGSVVDEVKWRDLFYGRQLYPQEQAFEGVTVLRSMTKATTGALSVKERKLNLSVCRRIPIRTSAGQWSSELHASPHAADILAAVCFDPKIGNRKKDEFDDVNVYDTLQEVRNYFNTYDAGYFCYTFDKEEFTFEDTVASIAGAVFCTAYRHGKKIRLAFEKETNDSVLLFNHRNKIPNTETRNYRFGYENEYDGLEYTWVNPADDAVETMRIPEGSMFNNTKKVESIGVRNYNQAFFHAWRAWNKIIYQNTSVEFDSIAQGELLLVSDRILVANGTSRRSQEGDITHQSGLTVTLSQPVQFDAGKSYTIHLQLPDATVQSMAVYPVSGDKFSASLQTAPRLPLVTGLDDFTRTKYIIIENGSNEATAFLVSERTMGETNTCKIEAVNYDSRYYEKDGVLR